MEKKHCSLQKASETIYYIRADTTQYYKSHDHHVQNF
uniref:Uncharacterized protein n=1 Tax=Anguilla anguilla TaxID=7936 RepID=A0A0E9T832_ANGAN